MVLVRDGQAVIGVPMWYMHRTTNDISYRPEEADNDDWAKFPGATQVEHLAARDALKDVPVYYRTVDDVSDEPREMTQNEKDTKDAEMAAQAKADLEDGIKAKLFADPIEGLEITVSTDGLVITVDITDLIDNDQTTVTADQTDTKYVLVSLVYDSVGDEFIVAVREKTDGEYDDLADDEVLVGDLKEYSCVAQGTTLTEV